MYEIIGINYERRSYKPDIIYRQGRTYEILSEIYEHGKNLWNADDCSKYLIALLKNDEIVDYNRPDYWNFENKQKFKIETEHFASWDYNKNICPYEKIGDINTFTDCHYYMCAIYQNILDDELKLF